MRILHCALMCMSQLDESGIEVGPLALQVADLRGDLVGMQAEFEIRPLNWALARDENVVNLRQRETELLAFENHPQMQAITAAVEACRAAPARMQEATVLVETKGPQTDAELARHIADCEHPFGSLRVAACTSFGVLVLRKFLALRRIADLTGFSVTIAFKALTWICLHCPPLFSTQS